MPTKKRKATKKPEPEAEGKGDEVKPAAPPALVLPMDFEIGYLGTFALRVLPNRVIINLDTKRVTVPIDPDKTKTVKVTVSQ